MAIHFTANSRNNGSLMMRLTLFLCLLFLLGCDPPPPVADNSQHVNAGVDIVPEAVLAAQKQAPSNHDVVGDQLDLIDVISDSDEKHYTMIELLRTSGLVPLLQRSGPFTVLAPTDEAFGKLPPGVLDRLMQPAHHRQLVDFVKYHLLDGRITMADLLQTNGQVPTLDGPAVTIKGIGEKAMVNDANVIRSETSAANGVVHWLDNVLLPPVP